MSSLEINEVAFNLALFKKLRFYYVLEPNGTKIFNYNVYRVIFIILIAYIIYINLCGLLGFILRMEDNLDEIGFIQLIYSHLNCLQTVFKIGVCVYNAEKIWDVLDVTRINFIKSTQCLKHIKILHESREVSIRTTNFLYIFITMTVIVWLMFPLLLNIMTIDGEKQRYENILNFRFPVTIHAYNYYYIFFYVIEVIVTLYLGYSILVIDILLISIVYVFTAQYGIHAQAFENIGYEQEFQHRQYKLVYQLMYLLSTVGLLKNRFIKLLDNQKQYSKYYEDLKSIIFDQQKVHLKLKSFCSIVWLMTMVTVAMSPVSIIILSYSFIVIFTAAESLTILNIIKLSSACLYLTIELFLYCYLLENINVKRAFVTFGMYSSNWIMMDLKFKKLLLLTMQINDANKLTIKITPTKSINLNFFSNVIMTCYNIVSVMLRTRNTNNGN